MDFIGNTGDHKHTIERRIAQVTKFPFESPVQHGLTIRTQVAKMNVCKIISKGQCFQDLFEDGNEDVAKSDQWCLEVPHRLRHPRHAAIFELSYYPSCFVTGIDSETSSAPTNSSVCMELVLLVHWQEYIRGTYAWEPSKASYLLTENWREMGVVVIALVVRRTEDGKAVRVALVPIPYESWAAASPTEQIVELV
jgi:hypothetical protein